MLLPQFPKKDPPLTREDVINQRIPSIAMEELGLSHIINVEDENPQSVLPATTIQVPIGPTGPEGGPIGPTGPVILGKQTACKNAAV